MRRWHLARCEATGCRRVQGVMRELRDGSVVTWRWMFVRVDGDYLCGTHGLERLTS